MINNKPDYINYGASEIMGPNLRKFVEKELAEDLRNYNVPERDFLFDWSQSCGEGHSTEYLDGILENFSYVVVFDKNDGLIAEGWIDFVEDFNAETEKKKVYMYWDFVTTFDDNRMLARKSAPGIPEHIWSTFDEGLKSIYKSNKQIKIE